jgi:pyruvate dehydrogenase E2 component (dihydrolipoamide acetyltransferase)
MLKDVKIPEISENVTSGTIVEVLVKAGDTVAVDDVLVEMETEKAVVEIPSPYAGKISDVLVEAGDEKHVGDVIVRIETDKGDSGEKDEDRATPSPDAPADKEQPPVDVVAEEEKPADEQETTVKDDVEESAGTEKQYESVLVLQRRKPVPPKKKRKPPARRPRPPLPYAAWPVNWVSISTRFAAAVATAVSARRTSTITSRCA